jgi:hypothetical protein
VTFIVPSHFLVRGSGQLVLLVYCSMGSSRENNSQSVHCSCVFQTVSTARSCLLYLVTLCVRLGCFSAEVASHHSSVFTAHDLPVRSLISLSIWERSSARVNFSGLLSLGQG